MHPQSPWEDVIRVHTLQTISIDTQGWRQTPEDDGDLTLTSPDGKGMLRITTYAFENNLSLASLQAISKNVREGAATSETKHGDFYGLTYDILDEQKGLFRRESFVSLAEIMLFTSATAPLGAHSPYMEHVADMLDSLADARP